jgi:hypothetical protein
VKRGLQLSDEDDFIHLTKQLILHLLLMSGLTCSVNSQQSHADCEDAAGDCCVNASEEEDYCSSESSSKETNGSEDDKYSPEHLIVSCFVPLHSVKTESFSESFRSGHCFTICCSVHVCSLHARFLKMQEISVLHNRT